MRVAPHHARMLYAMRAFCPLALIWSIFFACFSWRHGQYFLFTVDVICAIVNLFLTYFEWVILQPPGE